MAKQYDSISPKLKTFIEEQKIFFVGTARAEGRINVSPKGMDSLRVLGPNKLIWLNLTGSGNETAIHLEEHNRMTIMFCSFEQVPMILRLYGHAKAFHPDEAVFEKHISSFPPQLGARQIIEMEVDLVQTSCGFAVPLMDFKEERGMLVNWSEKKGAAGIEAYWQEKNKASIDGFRTDAFD